MDLKRIYNDNKAVSPVIGVVLMVAITVILAAAIGSSVFGQGTSEPAPQANLAIQPISISDTGVPATVKVEHLGGDPINFGATLTKVTVSVNGDTSETVDPTVVEDLDVLSVGDVKTLKLGNDTSPIPIASGSTVKIKIVDIKTSQLICEKDLRF
ncbi:type IV pilin [Methanosarcina soligelidi]|uniref:type IV pilin n=1 Tax=Methanosarcina soligelidi TaxID=1036677 RepID=UPI00064EA497|nr:type IV pilin [Methanosarcina soligelidi]